MHRIIPDASLVSMLFQELRRRCPKRAIGPVPEQLTFADLIYPPRQVLLRLDDLARSSAFANSNASEHLIDMPDPATLGET